MMIWFCKTLIWIVFIILIRLCLSNYGLTGQLLKFVIITSGNKNVVDFHANRTDIASSPLKSISFQSVIQSCCFTSFYWFTRSRIFTWRILVYKFINYVISNWLICLFLKIINLIIECIELLDLVKIQMLKLLADYIWRL